VIKVAIPLLHVSNPIAALQFYCTRLGFRPEFAFDQDGSGSLTGPSYMGFSRDGVWIHLSSFPDDGVAGGVANLVVDDVDALRAELVDKGVAIDSGPMNQTWGRRREIHVKDADGNCIRFVSYEPEASGGIGNFATG
jgi:uncharacterized glyoxalase superfamily protein PhnB